MPENVNLIGIVCDVYEGTNNNVKSANSILSGAGASFLNLRVSEAMEDFLSNVEYVPTTFFVDPSGEIIGEEIIGSSGADAYMKRAKKYLK